MKRKGAVWVCYIFFLRYIVVVCFFLWLDKWLWLWYVFVFSPFNLCDEYQLVEWLHWQQISHLLLFTFSRQRCHHESNRNPMIESYKVSYGDYVTAAFMFVCMSKIRKINFLTKIPICSPSLRIKRKEERRKRE